MRALVLACGACGAASTPTPKLSNVAATSAPAIPAAFAALFEAGATWRLGAVTCRIEAAGEVTGGWRSSLRCTGSRIASRVDHDFAATRAGLWIVDPEWDADLRTLPANKMVMAAAPKPIMRGTIEDPSYPTGRLYELRAHHGAWCMSELGYGGDEAAWRLCVSPAGVTGGWGSVFGETGSFGDVPAD